MKKKKVWHGEKEEKEKEKKNERSVDCVGRHGEKRKGKKKMKEI